MLAGLAAIPFLGEAVAQIEEEAACTTSADCPECRRCNANNRCAKKNDGVSCSAGVCVNGLCEPRPASDPAGSWSLVFRDDFNGSSLDTSKWNEQFPWGGSRLVCCDEQQYYTTGGQNLEFANGKISLVAKRETIVAEGQTHPYSSALIQTRGKFEFSEGYVECRAKMPNQYGTWPAFWTLPVDTSGSRPEWDILECYGDEPTRHSMCWHLPGPIDGCETDFPYDVSAFHVYGFRWNASNAIWYRDGVEVFRRGGGFNVPSYLLLNLAIHARAAEDDPTKIALGTYPAKFTVDYVYAWQRA